MNLTPEQWFLIVGAVVGLVLAIFAAVTKLITWFSDYVTRVAEQKIEEKKQGLVLEKLDTETEIQERKNEAEARRRQDLALSETVERVLVMFSQYQDRHAKTDERHAEAAEKKIESDKQLATAIENLTRSAMTSQLWQENRANDFLDTANLINEKMGELSRVGKNAIDALDRLEVGLTEARAKLNLAMEQHASTAQQSTLLDIRQQLLNLAIIVERLSPKAAINETQPLPDLPESPVLAALDVTEADKEHSSKPNEDEQAKEETP